MDVPGGIYAHIAGVDVVRAGEGEYYVLEDNLRVPSGVSYMLENRKMMMRLFPELFATQSIRPVEHYPDLLLENLRAVAPAGEEQPDGRGAHAGRLQLRVLRARVPRAADGRRAGRGPGPVRAERHGLHAHDARPAARARDLPARRRRLPRPAARSAPDSMLGVPGLFAAYRAGRVTLANAIGTGVADDKSIYPYVPDMIRFYLAEEPILNNVPTLQLRQHEELRLRARAPRRAGGQGSARRRRLRHAGRPGGDARPSARRFARASSRSPTSTSRSRRWRCRPARRSSTSGLAPRHIDLRPYVLSGKDVDLVPGGLTRVALREGSLVVNSSQGGGTKDTWVLGRTDAASRHDLNSDALPHRQRALLDGAPHRARREHRAPARRHLPHVAAAVRGRSSRASPGPSRGRCR